MFDAGSSPTSTVARPGGGPPADTSSSTSLATSSRTRCAISLPSMIVAANGLPLGDRSVGGHQLALGSVAGEAHDDDPARLDPNHDALAEGGVGHVVAQAELGLGRVVGA